MTSTQRRGLGAVLGVVVGLLARNLPVWIASEVISRRYHLDCQGTSLDCAFTHAPDAISALVELAALTLALAGGLAAAGVVVLVRGRDRTEAIAAGVTLVVPALWLAGYVGLALVR